MNKGKRTIDNVVLLTNTEGFLVGERVGRSVALVKMPLMRNTELLPLKSLFALVILLLRFSRTTSSFSGALDIIWKVTSEARKFSSWRKRTPPEEVILQIKHGDVDESMILTLHSFGLHGVYFLIISSNSLLVLMSAKFPQPG
jgi:hypothetical protein